MDYLQNQFVGQVHPLRIKRNEQPPVLQRFIKLGEDETKGVYTVFKVFVREPNIQYPAPGYFISLNNARGSCYCRLHSSTELKSFIEQLIKISAEVDNLSQSLAEKELQIGTALKAYSDQMAAAQALKAMESNSNDV